MPIYEYRCPQCGTKFEEIRTVAAGRFARCPKCDRKSYKVVSPFTFTGFHPFNKDGEGFSSVSYRPEEYRERVKNNLAKEDKL